MSDLLQPDDAPLICGKCGHGREVCTFCRAQYWVVFKMICDCGLYEHGEHTIDCEIVTDELRHSERVGGHPRIQSEAEHGLPDTRGRPHPVDWGAWIVGWTEADDEAWRELLEDG